MVLENFHKLPRLKLWEITLYSFSIYGNAHILFYKYYRDRGIPHFDLVIYFITALRFNGDEYLHQVRIDSTLLVKNGEVVH